MIRSSMTWTSTSSLSWTRARSRACSGVGGVGGSDPEQVDVAGDRLQRRPQLVTHAREELDLGAPRLLGAFPGSLGVGPSAGLADGDDDQPCALLDQFDHPLARRARLTEHHHQLADGLSVDGEQRNELDAPEAERAGERTERLVAFQCVAHDDATMLQQSDAEGVGAGRVCADQRNLIVVDAKRRGGDERPGRFVVKQQYGHVRARERRAPARARDVAPPREAAMRGGRACRAASDLPSGSTAILRLFTRGDALPDGLRTRPTPLGPSAPWQPRRPRARAP